MSLPKILIQLDADPQASTFDAVVAVDAGVDQLLQYSGVEASQLTSLVHGAMFTRAPSDLRFTAIFIGGSQVAVGERLLAQTTDAFFGPMRVSVMLDCNGANTTAAAAVLCAARHEELADMRAVVLGGTGPVGGRVAKLLYLAGANVCLVSRDQARADSARQRILDTSDGTPERLAACAQDSPHYAGHLEQANAVFGCGAAGVELLAAEQLASLPQLKVAIDLNAVAPAGLGGIAVTDKAAERGSRLDYGAIGVGGLKMRIHREAIDRLFSSNDRVLDAEQIFAIGRELEQAKRSS